MAKPTGNAPERHDQRLRLSARFGMTKAWRGPRALNALLTETGSVFA
ncbi:hypothetical protein ACQPYK_18125 [Streptosporangium sp. CA-135522]